MTRFASLLALFAAVGESLLLSEPCVFVGLT